MKINKAKTKNKLYINKRACRYGKVFYQLIKKKIK